MLEASEEAVGLNKGQAGNSEVGHMTIGAGRVLKQSEILVNDFFENVDYENKNVAKLMEQKDKDVHIMGLCSDGNIHAGVDDFISMYKLLVNNGFKKIHFHLYKVLIFHLLFSHMLSVFVDHKVQKADLNYIVDISYPSFLSFKTFIFIIWTVFKMFLTHVFSNIV